MMAAYETKCNCLAVSPVSQLIYRQHFCMKAPFKETDFRQAFKP